jgi:hypothetical protein
MGPQRIRMGLLGAALLAGFVLLLLVFRPRIGPLGRAFPALQARALEAQAASHPGAAAAGGSAEGRSLLADDLNSAGMDVHSDLRLINEIFIAYRGAVRSGNPVGENAEITAALLGRNRLGFAFIPAGNPAVNARGELCDRWGTPYFFHQLSGEKMEIRSAGPDRKLWTADDQVLTP